MKKSSKFSLVSLALVASLPSALHAADTARVTFIADNIRDEGVSIRGARMEHFSVPGCVGPRKLTKFFLKKNSSERAASPVYIPAGDRVGLTFSYSDARFAENRSCAVSGSFFPAAGENYIAKFSVQPGVASCTVHILKDGFGPEEFTEVPSVCESGLKEELPSGIGYILKWKIRVRVQTQR